LLASDDLVKFRGDDGRHVWPCREALSAALRADGHSLGPGAIRARERAGGRRSPARPMPRDARDRLSGLICMALGWIGLANRDLRLRRPRAAVRARAHGALDPRLVWAGEWWRPLTGPYLHTGIDHLVSNLMAGAIFGLTIVESLGAWRTLALFQVSALVGSVVAAYTSRARWSGASGGVFGLLGRADRAGQARAEARALRRRRGVWLTGLLWLGSTQSRRSGGRVVWLVTPGA